MYQIPFLNADGSYSVQKVEIKTFDQPAHLKGSLAEILVSPSEDSNSLVADTGVGRFTEATDGTLIPSDFTTLQATAIYAHVERLKTIDSMIGIESSFMWPAKIGIGVNYTEGGRLKKNNAYYIGDLNAFLLVPYTSTNMPITLNGGILAHEHFHQIFQLLVMNKLRIRSSRNGVHVCAMSDDIQAQPQPNSDSFKEERQKLRRSIGHEKYNLFLLRGLNEGLADFWGWLYTGDANFIEHSMVTLGQYRSLSNPIMILQDVDDLVRTLTFAERTPEILDGAVYDLGMRYARFLKQIAETRVSADKSLDAARAEVAQALVRVLRKFGDEVNVRASMEFIDPDFIAQGIFAELNNVSSSSCDVYNLFVSDARPRPTACQSPVNGSNTSSLGTINQ